MPHIAACTVAAMSTSNDKVPMTSKVEMVSVSTLEPYANNTRVHTAGQVEKIAKSIRQFGFITPVILSKEGEIVAGHGRLLAAKKLGILKVPCIRAGHLTRSQWRAYSIADNRLTELGGWDTDLLTTELRDLKADDIDLTLVGFTDVELIDLLDEVIEKSEPAMETLSAESRQQKKQIIDPMGVTAPAAADSKPAPSDPAGQKGFTVIGYCENNSQQLDAMNALRMLGIRCVAK